MLKTIKTANGSKSSLARFVTRRNFLALAFTILIRQVLVNNATNVIEQPTKNRQISSMHATSSTRSETGSCKDAGIMEHAMMNVPVQRMTRKMGCLALAVGVLRRLITSFGVADDNT
jgi:hypothetical protein